MSTPVKPSYNLLDEPWIPVRTPEGTVREIGLSELLLGAGQLAGLAETAPPNLVALHRLLLAMLHRALTLHHGRWGDADRAKWFREGLPEEPIRAYLEQWRDRFWLFHPTHPFMQVTVLAEAEETRDKIKPWTQISLASASGNTPVMFDHALDDTPASLFYPMAIRHLLGFLQFTPGGLVKILRTSDNSGALSNTAAVLPVDKNLAQALILGLHPWNERGDDLPAWEQAPPTLAQLNAPPSLATGPNDRYTRLSRAVLLHADEESESVRHIGFAVGRALGEDPAAPDPMTSYRINKDSKPIRIGFHEGRAVWRDLPSLLPDGSHNHDQPAAILGWAANLYTNMGLWDQPVQVMIAGLASDQAKLLRWRAERLSLPIRLLTDPDGAALLRLFVRDAEALYFKVRGICTDLVAAMLPDPNHKDTKAQARAMVDGGPTQSAFFSRLERALPHLLDNLASETPESAIPRWNTAQIEAAEHAWEATRDTLGQSPAAIRAVARVQPRLHTLLRPLKPTPTLKEEIPA